MNEVKITPNGWVETSLSDIALVNPRESLSKGSIAINIPMDCIDSFSKKIQRYNSKGFEGGTKFRNGDTLLARITPCLENGKTAFVDILNENEIGFGSTEYLVFREIKEKSDKHFIYYLSISPRFREIAIKAMSGTSGRQRVQTDMLVNHKFYLPKYEEQKSIASILTTFDNKIELLQVQNKTLEETAQTIFVEWFNKYNNGKELPEGWQIDSLEKIANHSKTNIKPFDNPSAEYYHYSLPSYDNGLIPVIEKGEMIKSNKYLVESNSFLVSKLNPFTPRIWTIFDSQQDFICSTEFQVVKPKEELYFPLIHCFLNSDEFTSELSQKIKGTSSSHQRVNPQDIFDVELVIPSENDLINFNSVIYPLIAKKNINHKQIQTLSQTRNELLPRLMSGEIRVNEFKV